MGSLAGHVLPGCLFLVYGFMWAVLSMWMHLKARVSPPAKTKCKKSSSTGGVSFFEYKREYCLERTSWLPFPCCQRIPLETIIIKILLSSIGIIAEGFFNVKKTSVNGDVHLVAEVYHVYGSDGKLNDLGKLHHITMYGAFLLSGIVDIVTFFVRLPRQTSMVMFSVAFWVEWMLFYSHSDSNDALNVNIHFILTLIILSCVVFAALRLVHHSHLLINMGLSFSIFLQGTWFIQVGAALFPPGGTNIFIDSVKSMGEVHSHRATMFLYALFTWHVILILISMLVLWVILSCILRCRINRQLGKFQKDRTKLDQSSDFESDENERLITVEDGMTNKDNGVSIEMCKVAETVS